LAIIFKNGTGNLYDKGSETPLGVMSYQLMETKATKYTSGKWWGELSIKKALERTGRYVVEFDDVRKGECSVNAGIKEKNTASRFYYGFFGRGKLGKGRFGL